MKTGVNLIPEVASNLEQYSRALQLLVWIEKNSIFKLRPEYEEKFFQITEAILKELRKQPDLSDHFLPAELIETEPLTWIRENRSKFLGNDQD